MLAAIRGDADASPETTRFETVAETVFRRYSSVWKGCWMAAPYHAVTKASCDKA